MTGLHLLDIEYYRSVNHWAVSTSWLLSALADYALWGGVSVLAAMLIAAYVLGRGRGDRGRTVATTAAAGVGVVVALLVNQHVLSPAVARTRPCHALAHVEVLLTCAHDYSFPSDHCVMAGAFAAGLAFVGLRWFIPAVALALVLAFSRVYVGVHYPSDVIAGLLFGAAVGVIAVLVLRPVLSRLARWLARTPVHRLVVSGPAVPASATGAGQTNRV
jgi:undecaprenyl-diphosphatase